MTPPVLTLLTDYGLEDEFVGVCHGVIARICPEVRIIDVTHGIGPQDLLGGALRLTAALPYLPVGVHVAVVDPGVGSERRAVALRCADERILVGPDNGLLWPAAQRAGGITAAVEISDSPFCLQPVSATFHGRDIFAPVGAHLAAGRSLDEAGVIIEPDGIAELELPGVTVGDGALTAAVMLADHFGNLQLNCSGREAAHAGLRLGDQIRAGGHTARYAEVFADGAVGELILYEDASGHLALAVNQGSAAERLGLAGGSALKLERQGAERGG